MNVRRRRKGRGWTAHRIGRPLLITAVIAIAAFGVGYALSALAFTAADAPVDVVLVPDVRDLQLADADQRVSRSGLVLAVGDSFPNPDIPEGAILAQSPLPGQEVGPGAEVRVIVSTGRHRPVVPEISSMSVAMAQRALETAGFQVVLEERPGEAPPGEVIGVDPPPGTRLLLPDTVVLRVGAQAPYLWMPDVVGLSEDSARVTLELAGLRVTEVMYDSDPEIVPYQVIAQEPLPGDSVDMGSSVRLRVTMPGVDRPVGVDDGGDDPDASSIASGG